MKQFNKFIIERLKLNKDTKINTTKNNTFIKQHLLFVPDMYNIFYTYFEEVYEHNRVVSPGPIGNGWVLIPHKWFLENIKKIARKKIDKNGWLNDYINNNLKIYQIINNDINNRGDVELFYLQKYLKDEKYFKLMKFEDIKEFVKINKINKLF